jgi:hypothetical protein
MTRWIVYTTRPRNGIGLVYEGSMSKRRIKSWVQVCLVSEEWKDVLEGCIIWENWIVRCVIIVWVVVWSHLECWTVFKIGSILCFSVIFSYRIDIVRSIKRIYSIVGYFDDTFDWFPCISLIRYSDDIENIVWIREVSCGNCKDIGSFVDSSKSGYSDTVSSWRTISLKRQEGNRSEYC